MAKTVLFQAALLLLFIAGGHSQPPLAPLITPNTTITPPCVTAIMRCKADKACAPLYAAFEESCRQERNKISANCTQQCRGSILLLVNQPLGLATLLCDCGSAPIVSAACRTSQTNLQANCFPAPPPGMLQPCHGTL